MKRPLTYFALGVTALAFSNCARHPTPIDPSSRAENPVTLSHEAVHQQETKPTAWEQFSKGVRGLDDPVALARDPDRTEDELYTKKHVQFQCAASVPLLWPEASSERQKKFCDDFVKDQEVESYRGEINNKLGVQDTGLTVLEVAGAFVAPPSLVVKAGLSVVGGIGGAVIDDVGHYVFQQNAEQDGSQVISCLGDIAKNTGTLPWDVVKAGWGFVSGTGYAVASLFSSDEPVPDAVAPTVPEAKPVQPAGRRATLKQVAAEQVEADSLSPISAERRIIMEGAKGARKQSTPSHAGGPG